MDKAKVVCLSLWILLLSCFGDVTSSCNETLECLTTDGKRGVCEENQCLTTISSKTKEQLEFTITVRYPYLKLKKTGYQHFYIRGSGLGLTWKKGKLMTNKAANRWTITIIYKSSFKGFQCQNCSDVTVITKKLQYRIFLDDDTDMVGGNFAINLPVSMTSSSFSSKPDFEVFPWFTKKQGTATNFTIMSQEIGKNREISLYLPPSFYENSYKNYPKIFVFDLSPMYLKLIKSSLDHLLGISGTTIEFVLIGFGDYQPPATERADLLTPTPGAFLTCKNGFFSKGCNNCFSLNDSREVIVRLMHDKCGKPLKVAGVGDKTLDFLLKTVLTKAQYIANNRILKDQPNTGIMGYSLGGLMACYAAWTRASVFGMAACQSPSLWWPLNSTSFDDCEFEFLNNTLEDNTFKTRKYVQKILLDAGSIENVDPYRLTQSTIEAAFAMSKLSYFNMNENLWLNIYPGSPHTGKEWAIRFWTTLQTLLPSAGDPRIPKDISVGSGANNRVALTITHIFVFLLVLIFKQ